MFSFHSSDVPALSSPSFEESPVSHPSNTAFMSDSANLHLSEDSTHVVLQPFEQTSKAHPSKRNSVFALRSRSNTATSLTSSSTTLSPPLSMANRLASPPSSPLSYNQHGSQLQGEASGSRKSIFRGKKDKRLSESHTSTVVVKGVQELDMGGKRSSVLRKAKRRNSPPETSASQGLKHRISSPFDFQHLTHTDRYQFATLEQTSSDLAAGFRAVRASQQPSSQLTGIRADDLHCQNSPHDTSSKLDQRSNSAMEFNPPSDQSPALENEWQQAAPMNQDPNSQPNLRLSRSVESFSQPGVKLWNHRHSQSTMGLPRLSSLPLDHADDINEGAYDIGSRVAPAKFRSKRESGLWDSFSYGAIVTQSSQNSRPRDDPTYVGHALTTPDELAIQAMTPPFTPGLEDVAEEPEMFVRPRAAPEPPVKIPMVPRSPPFDSNLGSQRSPRSRMRDRGNSYSISKAPSANTYTSRPISQMSDTLGTPNLIRRESVRRPSANRRQSNTWRAPEDSWEDDVDYIYDNALEAECDFEWDRTTADNATGRTCDFSEQALEHGSQNSKESPSNVEAEPEAEPEDLTQGYHADFRASLLMPSTSSMPELEPTSATSPSTLNTALPTPMDTYSLITRDSEGLVLGPSLLVSCEYKDSDEVTYEDLLSQYGDHPESHFTMIVPAHSVTSSARSSRVRSSRRSSYDSSLMSSTQSSGLWSSSIRRSASSAGSVPDLVSSQRTWREPTCSVLLDRLSDSVASLRNLDEEREECEDDVTPPGHISHCQTVFPSEDESHADASCNNTLKEELVTSLELARCGSQRSEHRSKERHHRQALSDGAAKLLMNTLNPAEDANTGSRNRAATTSHAIRQPMLSLFPTPPKRTYEPNHP